MVYVSLEAGFFMWISDRIQNHPPKWEPSKLKEFYYTLKFHTFNYTPEFTNMTMGKKTFENVSPIKDGDVPMSC